MRMDWDEYYINIAQALSKRGSCDRAQVGCVIVRDNLQLAEGYNGSISGHNHCSDIGHLLVDGHCVRTIHAEMNALLNAMKKGVSVQGATAYVTHRPCPNCTKHLNQAGIKTIIYLNEYRTTSLHSAFEAGIQILPFTGKADREL
ncbi:dCMP deaminase [Microcystis phage MaeS]|nr:dCMP deaminase [Microcystis phage MaeS]